MSTIFEEFDNLPYPQTMVLKHILSDGGYSNLNLCVTTDCVIGNVSTTKVFPPEPHTIAEPDLPTALARAEAIFRELHPDHECTEACDKHWREPFSDSDDSPEPSAMVN